MNLSGRASCLLSVLAVATDLVADAANRSNQHAVVSGIALAAKIVDVHVDDVGHGIKIEFPDLFDNGGAGNGVSFVAHQEFKQREFLRAEIDVVAFAADSVNDAIDFEVFNLENLKRRAGPSAQNGAYA